MKILLNELWNYILMSKSLKVIERGWGNEAADLKKKTEHEEKQVTFLHDLEKKKRNQKSCFITEFQVKECTSVVAPVDGHEKTVHDVDTWDHMLKADDSKDRKWNKNKVHSLACIFSQHATGSHSPTEIPHKRHETTSCSHSHL